MLFRDKSAFIVKNGEIVSLILTNWENLATHQLRLSQPAGQLYLANCHSRRRLT